MEAFPLFENFKALRLMLKLIMPVTLVHVGRVWRITADRGVETPILQLSQSCYLRA